ncbi:hypothetical protein R0137_11130 [Congregibacter brevis]|uniref:Transcriptional regulator, AlpA family n=1 Tax=Congregibacter brevis TaxID=3081201 RepID=A0ABZ0I9F0_9GAMM|nr:hypothetical protein R0137_11130 [Congregibacter sp. IMCC45268]
MSQQQPYSRKWVSDRFLSDRYEVSRQTIWRWAKIGKLPSPRKIGDNTSRWELAEADAAILGESAA